jgi:hypothetical protein
MPRWVRISLLVIGAALVVAVGAWAVSASLQRPPMTGVVVSTRNVALDATDQTGPAGQLTVTRVLAPQDSWIVVTTPVTPRDPGAVVGVAPVRAGETRGLKVQLQPGVALNQQLVLTLHADRGEIGRFEFDPARFDASPDKPYWVDGTALSVTIVKDSAVASLADAGGATVKQEVPAEASQAVLEVSDRLTVIDQLVVDRVVAPAPSWVAVYAVGDDGKPSVLAGQVHVDAGETLGVTVPIDVDVSRTGKLLLALHADLGTPGVFDFAPGDFSGSADKPYAVGDAELSKPVILRGYGMSNDNTSGSDGSGM